MMTVIKQKDIKIYIKIENLLLQDVVFVSEYISNLILLEQLQHNDVIY